MEKINFPKVSGKNLNRKKYNFPEEFPARRTLVLMAFYRRQQLDIDTWLPFADRVERECQEVAYVELPVVYKMNPVGQFMLNEGMRAGIPDQKARERTMTLYLNKVQFLDQLEIASEDEIQILLVGEDGSVLWRESGKFTSEKGKALIEILQQESASK